MNSRKRRFWKLWQKRNEELAEVNVREANRIRDVKFFGYELPDNVPIADYKHSELTPT